MIKVGAVDRNCAVARVTPWLCRAGLMLKGLEKAGDREGIG